MKTSIFNFRLSEQKKGFTIIELTIAIAILGIIMAATTSIFVTGMKNYQFNFQKSTFQKELNFTIDSISNDVKSGHSIPASHDVFTTSSNTLIVALPAIDENNNFIYTGGSLELDYIVYYFSNGTLRKRVYGNSLGKRNAINGTDRELLSNVELVNFQFIPGIADASQVKTSITLTKQTSRVNVRATGERTTNLRNKQP